MKIWRIVVFALLGLAMAGCRSDPEVAYLQRDNLRKQRKIEQLQNRIEDLEGTLHSSGPNQPGGLPHDQPPVEMAPRVRTIDGGPIRGTGRPGPAGGDSGSPLFAPPEQTGPAITVPGVIIQPGQPLPSPANGPTGWNPARRQAPADADVTRTDNRSVAQITLHPALTGGIGTGGRHGDEGLLVVVEPRDFGGNIVNTPGDISVALLDPAVAGEQSRLARWDFTVAETQGMLRTGSQPGIHLKLPWVSTPVHDRLKVFVRYTTRDGRKLQAERLVSVALSDSPPAQREDISDAQRVQTASRPERPQWSPVR